MRKKIAFIVQRYGLEVNGGAEYHCRVIAEKLKDIYDVEVLTSCAKDYLSWKNEYPEDLNDVNGIIVHRFATREPRNWKKFNSLSRLVVNKRKLYQKALRFAGLLPAFEKILPAGNTEKKEEEWIKCQGPYLPALVSYLAENHAGYDALIFFTYLYYPTVFGIKVAPEKSILVPTAHDEPPIYLQLFKQFFNTPAAILYNTASEKQFVNKLFNNSGIYSQIVGLGIDAVQKPLEATVDPALKNGDDFLIYIGRVDPSKGCKMLFDYFVAFKKATDSGLKLVVVGEVFMDVPVDDSIIIKGFVDDSTKANLLSEARALVIPSFYESLSLVTLESMAYGVPVIANKNCEVLKDHIENSRAGLLFDDYDSFKNAVQTITDPAFDLEGLIANAKKYIAHNYTWGAIIEKYHDAINFISRR